MTIGREAPATVPALVVRTQGFDRSLEPGRSYSIGRNPESDIVVEEARVSWRHAVLRLDGSIWLLEDVGSTNGTFVGVRRVQRVQITADTVVRLGHPDDGQRLWCSVTPARQAAPAADESPAAPTPTAAAGPFAPAYPPAASAPPAAAPAPPPYYPDARQAPRDPGAGQAPGGYVPMAAGAGQLPPAGPGGSSIIRQPSAIMRLPTRVLRIGRAADNEVVVSDLGVSRYHAELRRSARGYEIVDLNSHNGTYVNGQRVTSAPVTEADIVGIGPATFHMVGQELVEYVDTGDVCLSVQNLTVQLSSGKVLLDHVTFPLGERCLLGVIGPSGAGKSTLLGALTGMRPATSGSVLYDERDLYADYDELRHRIGLVPQENILHTQLSARKALGYAAELLTKPSLLFLDEPTSGLDPGLDMSVMEMMADLAGDGRTVIVVTHSVANLDVCDRLLVLVPGGKIAYFGPPAEGLRHFGQPGWAQVFRAFEAEPDRDWAGEYRSSAYCAQYVTAAMQAPRAIPAAAKAAPPPKSRNRLAQLSTLARRYLAVIAADRNYAVVLTVLPFVLGGLIRAVPAAKGLTGPDNV